MQRVAWLLILAGCAHAPPVERVACAGDEDARAFAIAAFADMSTPEDRVVMWSKAAINRATAEAYARDTARVTIGSTPAGLAVEAMTKCLAPREVDSTWDRLSARFAAGASGQLVVFAFGSSCAGTFARIELPALRANPRVRRIEFRRTPDASVAGAMIRDGDAWRVEGELPDFVARGCP